MLDSKQFARRWRSCNPNSPAPYPDQADEDSWRETTLELLSNAHTLGGISELAFEVVESNFSVSQPLPSSSSRRIWLHALFRSLTLWYL